MKEFVKNTIDSAFADYMNSESISNLTFYKQNNIIHGAFDIDCGRYGILREGELIIDLNTNKALVLLTEKFEGCGMEDAIERKCVENIDIFKGELPLSNTEEVLLKCIQYGRSVPNSKTDLEFIKSLEV